MGRFLAAVGLVFSGLASVQGQEGKEKDDKIGERKAAQIVAMGVDATSRLKGYHCKLSTSAAGEGPMEHDGVILRDVAAMTGAYDVYARADKYAVKHGERFVSPQEVDGEEGAKYAAFRNPHLFLGDLTKLAGTARWTGEEEVDGAPCKVAELLADDKTLMAQFDELTKKVKRLREFGKISGYLDRKESRSVFKVWIAHSDLRIRKIVWDLEPRVKKGALPPGVDIPTDKLRAHYELTHSQFDEALEVDIPKEAKAKLGIR